MEALANGAVVAGGIVMRVAMLAQRLRAAKQSRKHRRFALAFAASTAVAQVGRTAILFLSLAGIRSPAPPVLASVDERTGSAGGSG